MNESVSDQGRGKFIVFEGLDGSGKTTQIKSVSLILREKGIPVHITYEPGGTEFGDQVRSIFLDSYAHLTYEMDPMTETLLMFAARKEHVERVIRPKLKNGTWVLCDRFTDSTYAYQGSWKGVAKWHIDRLEDMVLDIQPDLVAYLDISPKESAKRVSERNQIKYGVEQYPPDLYISKCRDIRDGYMDRVAEDSRLGVNKYIFIDTARNTKENTTGRIMTEILHRFPVVLREEKP